MQTSAEYHDNPDNWGKYSQITLKSIVDDMLADGTDTANYLSNTKRSQIVRKLKDGINIVNRDVHKTVLAAQFTVSPSLYFQVPQDYMDWLRISVVDDDGRLRPLDENKKINTSDGYLQNHRYEVLFNHKGELLTTDMANAYQHPYRRYEFGENFHCGHDHHEVHRHDRNRSLGEFKVDQHRGTMLFSSNLIGRDMVLEYYSDGAAMEELNEREITVHKDLKQVLTSYAYYEIIARRRSDSVPYNEKYRAKEEYKGLRHKAVLIAAKIDFNLISRTTKSMP